MKIRYSESIVVYLDVLGFSNLVFNKDKTKIEQYFSYVQAELNDYLVENKFSYLIISDSIVISAKKSKDNLSQLIFLISKIQYQLFLKGILIRGGISFGKLYINKENNIIVGPGLINAYKLEGTAQYPRVIIDRRIIKDFFESTQVFLNYLNNKFSDLYGETEEKVKFDNALNDGKPYVNYMRKVVRYGTTYQSKNINTIISFFSSHYFQNDFFEKYNWLLQELRNELSIGLAHYENNSALRSSTRKIHQIKYLQQLLETL